MYVRIQYILYVKYNTMEEFIEYSRVREYAVHIGLDPLLDKDSMWIAKEGINAPLEKDWQSAVASNGDVYYYRNRTGGRPPIVQWAHPSDEHYKKLATSIRRKREAREYKERLNNRKNYKKKNRGSTPHTHTHTHTHTQ